MKKTIQCIHAVFAWTLLLVASQTQPASAQSILTQQRASDLTTYRLREGQPKTNCYTRQLPTYRSDNPAASTQLTAAQRRRLMRAAVWQDLRSHHMGNPSSDSLTLHEPDSLSEDSQPYHSIQPKRPVIIEAQGWTRDEKGRIHLTARPSTFTVYGAKC